MKAQVSSEPQTETEQHVVYDVTLDVYKRQVKGRPDKKAPDLR